MRRPADLDIWTKGALSACSDLDALDQYAAEIQRSLRAHLGYASAVDAAYASLLIASAPPEYLNEVATGSFIVGVLTMTLNPAGIIIAIGIPAASEWLEWRHAKKIEGERLKWIRESELCRAGLERLIHAVDDIKAEYARRKRVVPGI